MGRVEDIIEPLSDREFKLAARVAICAESTCLRSIAGMSKDLELIELPLDQDPSEALINNVQVMILQVDPETPSSIGRMDRVKRLNPSLHIIAGLPTVDLRTTRKMIRLGIEDLVRIPFEQDEVMACVLDVVTRIEVDEANVTLAPLVAIMKSVGGCGASTIATHLAAEMSNQAGGDLSVCLVDLDLQLGNVAPLLGLQPRLSLLDLIEADSRLDEELLRSVITARADGVDVIAAPNDIVPIESIDGAKLDRILKLARANYDVVILDLPLDLTNWALATIIEADLTIILGHLDLTSLAQIKRRLSLLMSLGYDQSAIDIVLNKTGKKLFGSVDTSNAERALSREITLTLVRDDGDLADAQSQGMLLSDMNSRCRLAKDLALLAEHVGQKVLHNA